jgi:glycosyltransferase involved in cell wall biosynthesis
MTVAPAVSLLFVAYGECAWLERALECAATNTDVEHEVIVVDNGTAPRAAAVLH